MWKKLAVDLYSIPISIWGSAEREDTEDEAPSSLTMGMNRVFAAIVVLVAGTGLTFRLGHGSWHSFDPVINVKLASALALFLVLPSPVLNFITSHVRRASVSVYRAWRGR